MRRFCYRGNRRGSFYHSSVTMYIPEKDHPVWKFGQLVVVGTVLIVMLTFNYKNGFEASKDLLTLFITIASAGIYNVVKSAITDRD